MHDDLELTKEQEAMFQPGRFVALHPESNHPDAGRVGKIISRKGCDMIVEFFNDDLVGRAEYSTIPLGHWGPVPEFFVGLRGIATVRNSEPDPSDRMATQGNRVR